MMEAFRKINDRCTVDVEAMMAWPEYEEIQAGMPDSKTQEHWKKEQRWGYEMIGRIKWALSKLPCAVRLSTQEITYGYVDIKYRLPSGNVVEVTACGPNCSIGRD